MKIIICILIIALLLLWRKNKITENELKQSKSDCLKQIQQIADIKQELDSTRRELDFYKNIEEDSGKLNALHSSEEQQQLLEQATEQINNARQGSGDSSYVEKSFLDSEQHYACEEMELSNRNFFITGKAGTGKSFLLNVFRRTTTKSHIVLAPTGIAALNVKGATLHSTFGYYNLVNLDVNDISPHTIRLKSEKRLTLEKVSTIIIDEISMVRADTFDKIDRILKVVNHNTLPFGGKQIIVLGDIFQLPPVAKKEEEKYLQDHYGGVHFFCSNAYKNGNFRFLELTVNHRQKDDEEYYSLLNRIRDGHATTDDINILNSRVVKDSSIYDRFTTLLPTKAEAEALNKRHIDQLNSVGYTYLAKVILDKKANKNTNLESLFPISTSLYLKKGALVMMVANDPEHRWVNGTLGIVNELSNDHISVSIDKRTYDINPIDFTEQEITYENGKVSYEDVFAVKQYPIVPAYAITIHKSQGQTYQNIVCDIDRCFASGQAYVALSRCASLHGLHLKQPISGASIYVDKNVLTFYSDQLSRNESRK